MRKIKRITCGAIIGAMLVSMTGCSAEGFFNNLGSQGEKVEEDKESASGELNYPEIEDKVDSINELISEYYYFDVEDNYQEEALYDGIVDGLGDPYSQYFSATEYAALMEENDGEYVGIGATVTQDAETKAVYVVKPMKGSPALEAGLQPGDQIIQVDDLVVLDQELDFIVKKIRGEEGSTAKVIIKREGEEENIEFEIPRRVVENITVEYDMLDNKMGYIEVSQFIDNTPKMFKEALEDLKGQGAKSFIIDLRNNPGGLLTAVNEMCDYFVEGGLIVYTEDKNGNIIDEYKATDGEEINLPTVVLVNENSASASEIFTGCLKDYEKATIVGTTTFGKGIVQSVIPLSDGSAVKLTIAKYFTPDGNDIHEIGIDPDVEIEQPEELIYENDVPYKDDVQLQKAIEVLKK